jgi:hypothetical protein
MWPYGAAILIALAFFSTGASAEWQVNELLRNYDLADANNRSLIEALISETENDLTWANSYLRTVRKEEPIFCHPKTLVLTGSQVIDMLRREVAENPNTGNTPFGYAILMTNIKVFPCSSAKNSN